MTQGLDVPDLRQFIACCLIFGGGAVAHAQHSTEAARASLAALKIPADLKVDLFAADPLLFNPVAFTIDEQGRFFIAESHRWKDSIFDLWTKDERWKLADFSFTNVAQREAFLRNEFATNLTLLTKDSEIIRYVQDVDGDGVAETSRVFADGFNKVTSGPAAGALAAVGQLWFACIPDLWRFEYDSQGVASTREILHTGYGVRTSVSGHDLHGLTRGFDGRIYFSVGDRGANVRTREGVQLENFNAGAVFRCEMDGSQLELFATGLRNPQDLAFDQFGNLWTHDNDTSGDDPPRVLHVVEGGEYGWLQAYQFMPDFGPWVQEKVWEGKLDGVLPPAGFGAQGPSGLATYPGVGLPEKYNGALLACDFPQGVWAYFFQPKGASYELRKEHFVWGLGPTDVDFGPDGAVYISDWGRSYAMPNAGRLLRVQPQQPIAAAAELRPLLGGGVKKGSVTELQQWLSHADMRVRMAAQFELERRGAWQAIARSAKTDSSLVPRIHAIWALGNGGRKRSFDPSTALVELTRDRDAEIRAQAAQQLGQVASTRQTARALLALLADSSPRVQMHAALSLSHAPKMERGAEALLALAASGVAAREPFVRHAIVHALTKRTEIELIRAAARSGNADVRHIAALAFRRMGSAEIAGLLNDPALHVRRDAARAINDRAIVDAFPALAARLRSSETDPQILIRAVNANFRLGAANEWQRVLQFASDTAKPEPTRIAAITALGAWNKPSPLDAVMGVWRPLPSGRSAGDLAAIEGALKAMLLEKSTNILNAALDCVGKVEARGVGEAVHALVRNSDQPDALRIRALNVLGAIRAAELTAAVQTAFADASVPMRAAAITWMPNVAPESAVTLIERILAQETDIRLQQSALASLGKMRGAPVLSLLRKAMDQLEAKTLRPEVQLEVIEAASAIEDAALVQRVARFTNQVAAADVPHSWALVGGDSAAGKRVFHEKDAVGCLRCHAIRGQGGVVGPDLAGIGAKRNREHLLQSIVRPNAHLTEGYESVSITMSDGRSIAGVVKSEDADEVAVESGEDGLVKIKKREIVSRERTLSAMPEGLTQLMTGRELRDLVEYLARLK